MKWLQWTYLDLNGLGGVETHIRCLTRELKKLGVEAHHTNDLKEVTSGKWDVVHTHGSNFHLTGEFQARLGRRNGRRPLWAHTLHGLTLERMHACGEYLWPGGYVAAARELFGSVSADFCFAIHPRISVFNVLSRAHKRGTICGNGWDSWGEDASASANNLPELGFKGLDRMKDFWVFVGRGDDRMKGVELLIPAISGMKLVAVPGAGFENMPNVFQTGPMTPDQVRLVMTRSCGLVLTSRYEGLPLVVLEALALGVPVVTSMAGGLPTLNENLQGLFRVRNLSKERIRAAMESAAVLKRDDQDRLARAEHNRRYLSTWADVAKKVHDCVVMEVL